MTDTRHGNTKGLRIDTRPESMEDIDLGEELDWAALQKLDQEDPTTPVDNKFLLQRLGRTLLMSATNNRRTRQIR